MHDMLVEKLLMLERLLLKHDYQELLIRTHFIQSHEKALRLVRLKEEQIKLLDDLLREYAKKRKDTDWPPDDQTGEYNV